MTKLPEPATLEAKDLGCKCTKTLSGVHIATRCELHNAWCILGAKLRNAFTHHHHLFPEMHVLENLTLEEQRSLRDYRW